MTICRIYWKERENPDNAGEGRAVADSKQAHRIVEESNTLFPRFKHWYEKVELQ